MEIKEPEPEQDENKNNTGIAAKMSRYLGQTIETGGSSPDWRSQSSGIKIRYEPMTDDSRIQIYQSPDGETRVDVRFELESIWLTQAQMGQVFDTTPENVLMHLKNIYKTGELQSDATAKDFLVVRTEGKRRVKRNLNDTGLAALTLLVAESDPKQKETLIKLIMNLLCEHET
jgi:hypothetical protein